MTAYKIEILVIGIIVHDKQIHIHRYNLHVNTMGRRSPDTPKLVVGGRQGRRMRLSSRDDSIFRDTIRPKNGDLSPCKPYIRILTS
jgi:hypothetical protein